MKKTVLLLTLVFALVSVTVAQDDYRKWEFYGGYSALLFDNLSGDTGLSEIDAVLGDRQTLRGFNLAVTRNVHRYVGVKFDYSLHLREDEFTRPLGSGTVDSTLQNILGGIQFKDNSEDGPRFKPFAHGLAGFAVQKVDIDSPQLSTIFGIDDYHANETSFAMVLGGGVDIRLNKRIDIRAIQLDWNIINRGDQNVGRFTRINPLANVGDPFVIPGTTQSNFRIGAGIVIH